MLAPIVIFAYNRQDTLQNLIESLRKNKLSNLSEVFIYIDGAKNELDKTGVNKVIAYTKQIPPIFKSIKIIISSYNKGLSQSIIEGVTQIINAYGKAIILEDDLICTGNFLSYMNQALDYYCATPQIMSICGYGLKIDKPVNYSSDFYVLKRFSSWGWATWKNRWSEVDWEIKDWEAFKKNKKAIKEFNQNGSDLYAMLKAYMEGNNQSWAIRFCYYQFKKELYSIHPFLSKINNIGFNASATHCKQKYSRFKVELDNTKQHNFFFTQKIETNKEILEACYKYHSLSARIYSKIRNFLKV